MEQVEEFAHYLAEAAKKFSLLIDESQSNKFLHYLDILRDWNRATNLTAIENPHEIIIKHFVDSLAPLRFMTFDEEATIVDIGTGAGFPALPLKILRSDLNITLLEPNHKKASFLHYIIGKLRLTHVVVMPVTLAEMARRLSRQFDMAVVRGIRPIHLTDIASIVKEKGRVALYRSGPLPLHEVPAGMMLSNEWTYELPFNFGSRGLTELTAGT